MAQSNRSSLAVLTLLALLLAPSAAASQTLTMVPMRDGVSLATDVYLPAGVGPWPVVLIRTPYGKADQATLASNVTSVGVAVVTQDLRGRFDSEGLDMIFTTDGDGPLKDGYDTMEWIVAQGFCNGLIGTTGASALGIAQYMQTSAAPPGLALMNPTVATPNLYQDGIFYGGVFRQSLMEGWLRAQGSEHFLDEIAAHPYEDSFYDSIQTHDQYGSVTVPGVHIGGWYDIFLQGTLDGFMGYQHQGGVGAAGLQKLIIGPWTHSGFLNSAQGELTYPANAAAVPGPDAFLTLLNHYLNINHPGILDTPNDIPTVSYYVMGDVDDPTASGNTWRVAGNWPPVAAPVRLHLQPAGQLAESCPPADGAVTPYVYQPTDPSPTVCGGNLSGTSGPCDQSGVESREDVIVFSTPVLTAPMEVTGRVRAHLFVDIDRPDTDVMVRLMDVYPDGRSMLIADGAHRLASRGTTTGITPLQDGEIVEAVVDLWSTSIILNTGHRLRLSVSSSNAPRFAPNFNNGLDYPDSIRGTPEPVTVRIHHEADQASYLEVPDPSRSSEDFTVCQAAGGGGSDEPAGCGCSASAEPAPGSFLVLLLLLGLSRCQTLTGRLG